MTALALPAGATRWTIATAEGKPCDRGIVRRWTEDDAQRLARQGVILTPGGALLVGRIPLTKPLPKGQRCPFCGAMKAIVRVYAELARWCFGCGRASA